MSGWQDSFVYNRVSDSEDMLRVSSLSQFVKLVKKLIMPEDSSGLRFTKAQKTVSIVLSLMLLS